MKLKKTKTLWLLSMVSMFADIASEMFYPIIPMYLKDIGVSIAAIGFVEGIAEITAGLTKGYFGNLSDYYQKRKPFIASGYFLSAISKPLIVVLQSLGWIFFVRTIDRIGKGLRTAARDAMLSEESSKETKARVFAFHRSWDTVGAIIGPVIVLAILYFKLTSIKNIFLLAIIPGFISVVLIYFIKEKKVVVAKRDKRPGFFSFFKHWKNTNPTYKKIVIGLCVFSLFNSSDIFLLLKSKSLMHPDRAIIVTIKAYILYNIVYAVTSYPFGKLADRFNKKQVLSFGLFIFALVYLGFVFAKTELHVYILFGIYGMYASATEGIAKAWISNVSGVNVQATALGLFSSLQSLSIMLASFIAGLVWTYHGSNAIFILSGTVAFAVGVYFWLFHKQTEDLEQ